MMLNVARTKLANALCLAVSARASGGSGGGIEAPSTSMSLSGLRGSLMVALLSRVLIESTPTVSTRRAVISACSAANLSM